MLCVSASHTFTSGKRDDLIDLLVGQVQCAGLFSSDDRKADPFLLVRIVLKFPFNTVENQVLNREPLGRSFRLQLAISRIGDVDRGSHIGILPYLWLTDFGCLVAAVCMSLAQRIDIFLL